MSTFKSTTLDEFRNHTVMVLFDIFGAVKAGIMTKDQAWDIIEKFLGDNVKDLNKEELEQ